MSLHNDVCEVADRICNAEAVTVISHIDADGITSEAVLSQAIARAGIKTRSVFVRQLEPLTMHNVPEDSSLKVFVDLGAGQQNLLEERGLREGEVAIIDHHVSQDVDTPYLQANGIAYGYTKLSAAGIAYFVSREMDSANMDLSKLAVIGNVGDMMAREHCGLVGPARDIVADGVHCGCMRVEEKELNCYGLSTRPVHVCLSYSDDPYIPDISNNTRAAQDFLERLGVPLRTSEGRWRVWEEMEKDEKRTIISALATQMLAHGKPADRLLQEAYYFPDEPVPALRNAAEFATVLNACGRWAKPRVGSSVCKGDRGAAFREAEYMLRHHRSVIRELVDYILDGGVEELTHLQYVHVGDRFPDTIIGIGAGIALSKLNRKKPIMILCYLQDEPELVKVSMRTNDERVRDGIDLQGALVRACGECGGSGGGHPIAAGAYIPKIAEKEFAYRVNRILESQSA